MSVNVIARFKILENQQRLSFARGLVETVIHSELPQTPNTILVSLVVLEVGAAKQSFDASVIAEVAGLPQPTVSRIVSAMLQHGWLIEEIDPCDRRKRRLSLGSNLRIFTSDFQSPR